PRAEPASLSLHDALPISIKSIVDKLRAKARETPPGTWVEGYFFDDTKVKDKRALNVHDLDEVSKEHPVVVQHRGGHTSFYNTKADRKSTRLNSSHLVISY